MLRFDILHLRLRIYDSYVMLVTMAKVEKKAYTDKKNWRQAGWGNEKASFCLLPFI